MKITRLTLTNIIIAVVLLASPFMVQLTSSAPYDPWSDLDEDGDIDIFDVVKIAGAYATTGDPGKNVSVTNWPADTSTTVWFAHPLPPNRTSSVYRASGFGHLHMLVYAIGLFASEVITVEVYGVLWDLPHLINQSVRVYSINLSPSRENTGVTIPIPSEEFYFTAYGQDVSTGLISMSFYLTWA